MAVAVVVGRLIGLLFQPKGRRVLLGKMARLAFRLKRRVAGDVVRKYAAMQVQLRKKQPGRRRR